MSALPLKVPLRFRSASAASSVASSSSSSSTSQIPALVPHDWRRRRLGETRTWRTGKSKNEEEDGLEEDEDETLRFDDDFPEGWLSCATCSSTTTTSSSVIDVAIGTRGGRVFVLQGPLNPKRVPDGLKVEDATLQARRASHSSQISMSSQQTSLLTSPTSPHTDTEGAGTSTSKTSALAELVEEHSHNGQSGVEEKLEAQWHLGNPNASTSSVVGNVMGALGIAQGNSHHHQHHAHPHAVPQHKHDAASSVGSSEPGSGAQTPSRRKASSTIGKSQSPHPWVSVSNDDCLPKDDSKTSTANQGRSHTAWSLRYELQTPSSSSIVHIALVEKQRRLLALQEDGLLCVWSLEDGTLDRCLDLGLTTTYPPDPPSAPINPVTPAPSGPLATLAALRASASSPAPRSRRNSNAGETGPVLPIKRARLDRRFTRLIKVRTGAGDDEGWIVFDDLRSNTWIRLDENASKVVSVQNVKSGNLVGASSSHIYARGEEGSLLAFTPSSTNTEGVSLGKLKDISFEGLLEIGNDSNEEELIVVWSRDQVKLLTRNGLVQIGESIDVRGIQQAFITGSAVCIHTQQSTIFLRVDARIGLLRGDDRSRSVLLASGLPLLVEQDERDCISLFDETRRQLWKSKGPQSSTLGCLLPLSMDRVVAALPTGRLALASLAELAMGKVPAGKEGNEGLEGTVCLLEMVVNTRTQTKHIVAGTREGDVAFYDGATLQLQGVHSLLTSPIVRLFALNSEGPRLRGCMAAVGADGTIAMFLLDGFKHLYVIPGRAAPLERMAVRGDEILLLYGDGRARMWDMVSLELRRSIDLHQALSLAEETDPSTSSATWIQHHISPLDYEAPATQGVLHRTLDESSVVADIRRAIEAATHRLESAKIVQILRPLTRSLAAFSKPCWAELISQAGGPAQEGQHVEWGTFSPPKGFVARTRQSTTRSLALLSILFVLRTNVARLRSIADECIQDLTEAKAEFESDRLCLCTLAAYTIDPLAEVQEAARQLFHGPKGMQTMEQSAIDALCETYAPRLPSKQSQLYSQAESITSLSLLGLIATQRYNTLSPSILKDISTSISLLIPSSSAYEDENKSPQAGKKSDNRGQAVAIDLCCQGFSIWQHYFDAMEVVRSLFALSTTSSSSSANGATSALIESADDTNRTLARRATLQIAQDNTPLFMTTLSLDILHARSASHCSATMRLVAFMVRKKPSVLYPNLPRLAEAVVKSLDPTNSARRESVSGSATLMISELVRAYPSIGFCGKLQRLAVGTHEGAVIMYDLKTATRLYVIEAQSQHAGGGSGSNSGLRLMAVDFSPDGRRLVTVFSAISTNNSASIAASSGGAGGGGGRGAVSVWKVGGGFSTFFQPGVLPKQGGAEGEAYKSVDFHAVPKKQRAKEGDSSRQEEREKKESGGIIGVSAVEEDNKEEEDDEWSGVKVEWPSERNVRISIGESQISLDVA